MKKWKFVILAVFIALALAWYAFRPERLVINKRVHEELPISQGGPPAQAFASGKFHGMVHPTQGSATLYRVADGSLILRFTDFKTSNGPDVHVYMVAADDAKDDESVQRAGFIDLGTIKGNIGDLNYPLGHDVDLVKYRAASVWCKRFSINFGAAALNADQKMYTRVAESLLSLPACEADGRLKVRRMLKDSLWIRNSITRSQ